jgi:hypothetical protein
MSQLSGSPEADAGDAAPAQLSGGGVELVVPLGPMDRYLLVAAGQRLYAPTLDELAEIAQCAIAADDRIELVRARASEGWRLLDDDEFGEFVRLLMAQPD